MILDYAQPPRRRKWPALLLKWLLCAAGGAMLGAAIAAALYTPRYTSQMKILVGGPVMEPIQLQRIIQSDVSALTSPAFIDSVLKGTRFPSPIANPAMSSASFIRNLRVYAYPDSGAINIAYMSSDPQESFRAVDAVFKNYVASQGALGQIQLAASAQIPTRPNAELWFQALLGGMLGGIGGLLLPVILFSFLFARHRSRT